MIDEIKKHLTEKYQMDTDYAEYVCSELSEHEDIVKEYSAWIKSQNYHIESPVEVEGWTAEKLHEKFSKLDDFTIFNCLRRLRDDKDSALDDIDCGFAVM